MVDLLTKTIYRTIFLLFFYSSANDCVIGTVNIKRYIVGEELIIDIKEIKGGNVIMVTKKLQKALAWVMTVMLLMTMVVSNGVGSLPVHANGFISPEVSENGQVTFRLLAGDEARARVAGSFTSWGDGALEMSKVGELWTLTVDLEPGDYEYKFILNDSQWMADPLNTDGSGNNSQFNVPGNVDDDTNTGDADIPLDENVSPYIKLVFDGQGKDYANWDVWVWNTGVKDDSIPFTSFEDGKAIAKIDVVAGNRVGFIVRQNDWADRAPSGMERDRSIQTNRLDPMTLVYVNYTDETFHIVPEIKEAQMVEGTGHFYYRDPERYLAGTLNAYEKVELMLSNGTEATAYEMTYSEENQWYAYSYPNLPQGSYTYSYRVTLNGETTNIEDSYFSGVLNYIVPQVEVTGTVTPQAINYNENAVLAVNYVMEEGTTIASVNVDLSAVGGPSSVSIDPKLNAVTISVSHEVTAGEKKLPIQAIDNWGNSHAGEATLVVNTRSYDASEDFDWDEAIIYFMITDRFNNGDMSNDDPLNIGYDKSQPGAYQGGDFKGVTQKLDYLKALGINTIWLTPIVENVYYDVRYNDTPHITPYYGYHGYWAKNFEAINPHLGTMADYHELIDEAHERGIKIMVDVVLNHVGYGLKATDANNPNPPAHFPTNQDRVRFEGMLRNGGSDEVQGELAGLPDLLTEDPVVRAQIIAWQVGWILKSQTANGNTIDYFRVDTVKHVEDTTWQAFKNALTQAKPTFKMIGESWGASATDDHGYLNAGMMDSLLDFSFNEQARNFVNGQVSTVESYLQTRNQVLNNTGTLGQFISSHDEPRFLSFIGEESNLGKQMVAASLQITAKGQPVIYYGDELGLTGTNNYPYYTNRQNMPWQEIDGNAVLAHYQKVLAFRNEYSQAFAKGTRTALGVNNQEGYSLFKRTFGQETVYIGLNVKETPLMLSVRTEGVVYDAYSDRTYTSENGEVVLEIPPMAEGGTVLLTATLPITGLSSDVPVATGRKLKVNYQNANHQYDNLGLWIWGDVVTPSSEAGGWPLGATSLGQGVRNDFGIAVEIPILEEAQVFNFLVNNHSGANLTSDRQVKLSTPAVDEVWVFEDGSFTLIEPQAIPAQTLRIHYKRANGTYEPWGLWIWGDVATASSSWPLGAVPFSNTQVGKYGAYVDIPLSEAAKSIGFLFVERQEGGQQTGDVSFNHLDKTNQIFMREGDMTIYTNPFYVIDDGIERGEILDHERMTLYFSDPTLYTEQQFLTDLKVRDKDNKAILLSHLTRNVDGKSVTVEGSFSLEDGPYSVQFLDRTIQVSVGWQYIDAMYAYEGELGATLNDDGTATLKLWSPKADAVSVILYDKTDQNVVIRDNVAMTKGDKGVWSVVLNADNTGLASLRGYFYHYKITHGAETKIALDPYAKSMAPWNSAWVSEAYPYGKAAIVSPESIGRSLEYADIEGYEKREDAIIYEIHVRDFTSDPTLDDELVNQFGTFASFVEKLDYIESLGVTHIQLLPVMSYFFANELASGERMLDYASTQTNYNWGYDPHSYFSLSGMYTTDVANPEKRIEEFKNLVHEIHQRGMGVVLDVVYNHTARVGIFEDLVPNYYHFMDADGTPRTSFGGGRLGTTHEMARRVLIDSITYWTDVYKIDGFRFDMMGDHDAESIQMAYDAAKALNPKILMIGEGWRTFAGDEHGGDVMPADQDWKQHTEGVGSFSDEFRNELKSGFGSEGQPRFLTGGARSIQLIFDNIKAQPHNFYADQPGDVVPYIAAHDNLTLHDVIAQSIKKDPALHQEEIHKRIRLGNLMVLTAQGTAFIHAGQEYGRTKQFLAPTETAPYKSTYMTDASGQPFINPYFIHDSYDSTDAINRFDWTKATDASQYPINTTTKDYTAGLIALRRSTDAFRLGDRGLVNSHVTLLQVPEVQSQDLAIAYSNKAINGDLYYVFINGGTTSRTFTINLDLRQANVLVDQTKAQLTPIAQPTGVSRTATSVVLEPLTATVIQVKQPSTTPETPGTGTPGTPGTGGGTGTGTGTNDGTDIGITIPDSNLPESGVAQVIDLEALFEALLEAEEQVDGENAKHITIERDFFTMEIPFSVIEALRDLAKNINNGKLVLSVAKLEADLLEEALKNSDVDSHVIVRTAGEVLELQLGIRDDKGDITPLKRFSQPIKITLKIAEGADLDTLGIYRIEENGRLVYVGGDVTKDGITTDLWSFSKYAVLSYERTFADVKAGTPLVNVLKKAAARHIIQGYGDGSFNPEAAITRSEFIALVVRALQLQKLVDEDVDMSLENSFADVSDNAWFASYIRLAVDAGLIQGVGNRRFAPNDLIKEEDVARILERAINKGLLSDDESLAIKNINTQMKNQVTRSQALIWLVK